MGAGRSHLVVVPATHCTYLLNADHAELSDSQRAIAHLESDKSAKSCHELVGDLGFTDRNPDPVGRKAGEGLAAAYGKAVLPQADPDPAGCAITAYAAGVDEYERRLGPASHREPQLRQLIHQVGAVHGDLIGSL